MIAAVTQDNAGPTSSYAPDSFGFKVFDAAQAALDGTSQTQVAISNLNDISVVEVKAQADQALAEYDPPTRTEAAADRDAVTGSIGALNDLSSAAVQSAADAAIGARLPAGESEVAAAGSTTKNLNQLAAAGNQFGQVSTAADLITPVGLRRQGGTIATYPWRLRPGTTRKCAWDAGRLTGQRGDITSISPPTSDDEAIAVVSNTDGEYLFQGNFVEVLVNVPETAEHGQEAFVRATVTLRGGQTEELVGRVLVTEEDA